MRRDFGCVEFDEVLVELSNRVENMVEEMTVKFCPSAQGISDFGHVAVAVVCTHT